MNIQNIHCLYGHAFLFKWWEAKEALRLFINGCCSRRLILDKLLFVTLLTEVKMSAVVTQLLL